VLLLFYTQVQLPLLKGSMNMPISTSLRYLNKKFTNKIIGCWAGKNGSPFSLVLHSGRKSGKKFQTPVIAVKKGSRFLFALTYGARVDWYRNILANGCAGIRYQGKEYKLEKPISLPVESGRKLFPQPLRFFLVLLKVTHFFEMQIAVQED